MFISNAYAQAAAPATTGFKDFLPLIILIALFFLIPYIRNGKFRRRNYEWYKSRYPTNVQGNQVLCFVCGNNRIQVRGLMNRTYFREHFCTQCGKTLYYSPEQN